MIPDPARIWGEFRGALLENLSTTPRHELRDAWHDKAHRTAFYSRLLRNLCPHMDLEFAAEFMAVDYVLLDAKSHVPMVAIESENDPWDTERELQKLCAFAAPVRVLMTVAQWDPVLGGWCHQGERAKYLQKWRDMVQGRLAAWPHPGIVVVVIGEWGQDAVFRVYIHELSGGSARPDDTAPALVYPQKSLTPEVPP